MQKPSLIYAQEVERVLYEASSAWEGIDAQEISLGVGEVILRIQPGFAAAMPLRFDTATVEEQLDRAIGQIEKLVPWCLWVIGPSSQPADLRQRLIDRGFAVRIEWEGLVLDDLSIFIPTTSGLVIEPLSWDNAQAYATAIAGSPDSLIALHCWPMRTASFTCLDKRFRLLSLACRATLQATPFCALSRTRSLTCAMP